jgi:hypothetical protein
MFATRYESSNNARRLGNGRHSLSAFLPCASVQAGLAFQAELPKTRLRFHQLARDRRPLGKGGRPRRGSYPRMQMPTETVSKFAQPYLRLIRRRFRLSQGNFQRCQALAQPPPCDGV